jgi:hypothetical protein
VISPSQAVITLSGLSQGYDGTQKAASITTIPSNLSYSITYNGSANAPTNAASYSVIATITDPNYSGSANGTLLINKSTPVINWVTPEPITYGTALSVAQLNASANVAGSFSYSSAIGTVLSAGTQTLSTDFTPVDAVNYNNVTNTTVSLSVNKAALLIKAHDIARPYGTNNPQFEASYIGKINIVVLGSSTAQGNEHLGPSKTWVNLTISKLNTDYPGMTNVTNLADGSLTSFAMLPTGTDNGGRQPVNPAHNITAALALNPQIIIINLPSNDVASGYSEAITLNNFTTIINTAKLQV